MNNHYKTYQSYSNPFDPCPPIKTKTYSTPPHLYMGYQLPTPSQFAPGEALRTGTLWKPLYDPYFNPRELAGEGNPIWQPSRAQLIPPYQFSVHPQFARKEEENIPHFRMPDQGMLPEIAYKKVHDEIALDGNAHLNLAKFVTTWMEPYAERYMPKQLT